MNLKFWTKKKAPEESDPAQAKPGFLTRLKSTLSPSRKKIEPDEEEEAKPFARRKDGKHRGEEPEPSSVPAEKPRKRLVIVLALVIPLAVGGGFFAATKIKLPPAKPEVI